MIDESLTAPASDASEEAAPAARRWRPSRLQVAWGLWTLIVLAVIVRWGVPTGRSNVFLILGLALVAAGAGTPRTVGKVVRDWAPLFAMLTAYDMLRGQADQWGSVHILPQIHVDEWLFGGNAPTVLLQHALFTPGRLQWWDYVMFLVYLSHFFVGLIVAALLWKFAYHRFHRYATMFVGLSFAAFATYALYPAAPPWLASQLPHALAPTAKVIDEIWVHIGLHQGASVFSARGNLANPVAAVPSLHSAYPFLLMLFFWRWAGRWRWFLPLYPLAMGFTLVYTGEHYVFDILLGWLYATVVFVVVNLVADAWARRRPRAELTPAVVT
jgi:hypothetical protein